ncbi:glutathione S-transferase family protein [Phenylobacterium sp.]|jgi:glutathione S-transferase|uniref:glutathione S-transferase family protein n=1 Tax=Phenylobacterium sp. TaxID=1871053 RepID=UPI002E32CAC9|nr:glutathione S-transferase family protein [Phenylobacterium sp.]HEX4710608.1 glutathione S-transferase family protein [Phenylobacterium sp.]
MQLYYSETLSPRKACAVAHNVNAELDFVFVDLGRGEQATEEFGRLNPNHKVPVLVDGPHSLWESTAIMCRLAQITGSDLWPTDDRQAEVIRWLTWDALQFTRFGVELYFRNLIGPHVGLGPPEPDAVREAQTGFRKSAAILDAHLANADWAVDSTPTIADFALGAALPYAVGAAIPFEEFPNISHWYARLCALRGWLEPFPKR